MSEATIYTVRYWVDFPSSEHGGVLVVLARSDEEADTLCADRAGEYEAELHTEARKQAIAGAYRVEVLTDAPSQVLGYMLT